MGRANPNVPMVTLPVELTRIPPKLTYESREALDHSVWTLSRLEDIMQSAMALTSDVQDALGLAADAMRVLAELIAPSTCCDQTEAECETLPVHECFGVRRNRQTPEQHAVEVAMILLRSLIDLHYALIDVNDFTALVEGMRAVLIRLGGREGTGKDSNALAARPRVRGQHQSKGKGSGLDRWVIAHHLYFLLNLYAAFAIQHAAEAVKSGHDERAIALLREGKLYIRGSTSAMVHAAAISAKYYREIVRPTMQPPSMRMHLTGAMQIEHALYRSAMCHFLEICDESFQSLARKTPALAIARDEVLEADLLDIERHICIASLLVGNDHSLVQHEQAPVNAVGALRRIRNDRASRYSHLTRFSDRLIKDMEASIAT